MNLFELFNQIAKYSWRDSNTAIFTINDKDMFVHFGPADYNNITETTVDVVFGMEGDNMTSKSRYGITGNGNAMTTFATVIDIIKTYAWRERPHQFMMSAAEPSRVKLYKRMVNAIKIPGYGPAEQDDIDGTIVWYIKRIDK